MCASLFRTNGRWFTDSTDLNLRASLTTALHATTVLRMLGCALLCTVSLVEGARW
jgi:hypothetical protein